MVVALVITSKGFPLAYEMSAGNTEDKTTLRGMLATLQRRCGATSFSGIIVQLLPETRLCVPKVTATVA